MNSDNSKPNEATLADIYAARTGEEAERYRNLLLWVLYHHQGSRSPVGQPIRKALGIGQYERLTANQIDAAARAGEVKS